MQRHLHIYTGYIHNTYLHEFSANSYSSISLDLLVFIIFFVPVQEDDHGTKVLNTKQSFEDCEEYAILEKWLGDIFNDYWYRYFDNLEVVNTPALNQEIHYSL